MVSATLRQGLLGVLLVVATAGCGSGDQASRTASNYPPNYTWGERCVEVPEFRACQYRQGEYFALSVTYRGVLRGVDGLSLYVKLNGRDGTFAVPSSASGNGRYVFLSNGYTDCRWDQLRQGWDCDRAPAAMQDLFFYASEYTWQLNAWDLELAAFDTSGRWDSRHGKNYQLRIEP